MKLSKKNKPWLIGGAIVLVIAIAIIVFSMVKKNKEKKEAEAAAAKKPNDLAAANPAVTNVYNTYTGAPAEQQSYFSQLPDYKGGILKVGDTNKGVFIIQDALNKAHNAGLVVDGIFGQNTANALQKYYGKSEADSAVLAKLWKNY